MRALGGRKRAVFAAVVVLAVAAAVAAIALPGSGSHRRSSVPDVKRVARRVEAVRGLRFRSLPKVRVLSIGQLEKEAKADESTLSPKERRQERRAEKESVVTIELMKLAGLLPPNFKPDSGGGETGLDLGGVYDPKRNELVVVKNAVRGHRREAEIVLAHELTHALEDQHFRSFDRSGAPFSESGTAHEALIEGSATLSETRYAIRYLGAKGPVSSALARRRSDFDDPTVPVAIEANEIFDYVSGSEFANSLYREGRGWRLVNLAHRHLPRSSEQILHPRKWGQDERSSRPTIQARRILGRGWRRLIGDPVGEFDTRVVLSAGTSFALAKQAAAGWAGGRFEVWERRKLHPVCRRPCRRDEVAILSWRWDSRRDAREFVGAVPRYVRHALGARALDPTTWRVDGGAVGLASTLRRSVLVFAPSARLARTLAATNAQP